MPETLKRSLRETGRPWRGPTGVLAAARWASREAAWARAAGKRVSERQFVWGVGMSAWSGGGRGRRKTDQLVGEGGAVAEGARHFDGGVLAGAEAGEQDGGGSVGDVELERAQVLAYEGGDVAEATGRRDLVGG